MSSFYNSSERVASLLVKITNQVIRSCKRFITENGSLTIWNQVEIVFFVVETFKERKEIERKLTQCITLNSQYRQAYQKTKNKNVGNLCLTLCSFFNRRLRQQKCLLLVKNTSLEDLTHLSQGFRIFLKCLQQSTSSQVSSTAGPRLVL